MAGTTESQENLVEKGDHRQSVWSLNLPQDIILSNVEKQFLLCVERGDCASVRKMIEENESNNDFDVNCMDPLNRSALVSAIENENIDLIHILLEKGIKVKDALLHAIKEEYVEAVEVLLQWEEEHHKPGDLYSWEAMDRSQSTFTPDITPLMLAAHYNNYEIIKILLDRGATLPTPHDVRCGCDDCVISSEQDSLRHSQARINAYKALTSPSLIALSSRDPLLTAFELSNELARLRKMENEFREEYNEMRQNVQAFAAALLDHSRTSRELDIILNHNPEGEAWEPGERRSLERLKLAIKYSQKSFVAHPNVQQLLGAIWYDGLPGFRRKGMVRQLIEVAQLGAMFPVYCSIYMMSPNSEKGQFLTKPFVKFICHSSSYAFFLTLLCAASQRIEFLLLEWFGNDWMQSILAEWKRKERGSLPGLVESGCMLYVMGNVFAEVRSLWCDGLLDYISDLWNFVDLFSNTFYLTWMGLRFTAVFVTWREYWDGWDPWYPREEWHPFDPMLLSEGMFSAAMIFSFLKLVHIFSVNPHLGPLQISLGRMVIDIIKFFFIYMLVLFAFGCGMNQLLWYYSDLDKQKCYARDPEVSDWENEDKACSTWRRFANMFETSQTLFWAGFGLVDLVAFELTGMKSFTRFWSLLMFGSYSVINIIVLLNMLIAMMSNSFQIISERSDVEWKFARSRLWMSYFEDGDILPSPFNMMPSLGMLKDIFGIGAKIKSKSIKKKSQEKAQERHDIVVQLLVKRYVVAEQQKTSDFGITEDDVMEIRQDISTLRYELVDILRTNGMNTPNLDPNDSSIAGKKGKQKERRLLKDFQIGFVEGVINEALTVEKAPKDIFGKIAKAIGKRGGTQKSTSSSKKDKDWNSKVRQSMMRRNPIGSTAELKDRFNSKQSLRRYILEHGSETMHQMDVGRLAELNPILETVSPATRVAYAKFKMRKIKFEEQLKLPEVGEVDEKETKNTEAPKPAMSLKKAAASSIKKEPAEKQSAAAPTMVATEAKIETPAKPESPKSVKDKPAPPPPAETPKVPEPKEAPKPPAPKPAEPKPAEPKPEPKPIPSGKSKVSGKVLDGWL
ncbi:transient receptor potential protein-like [Neocloeon triangulifer]|uniref:transient receptor potential protein-like n=1 Tax=Neocloeon triangulifer TaxID=2078957 RepID=UPI00286EB4BA|nr:transient receptor potential protein-like [Neocloeon triangulifer]